MSSGSTRFVQKINCMLNMAYDVSSLSTDIHTKHGCIIVDDEFHILGAGYNGLPKEFDDSNPYLLERPTKYLFMVHSEVNAVSNCTAKPKNAKAIVTGWCCINCLIHLHQNDICEIYMDNRMSKMLDNDEYWINLEVFRQNSKVKLYIIENGQIVDVHLSTGFRSIN